MIHNDYSVGNTYSPSQHQPVEFFDEGNRTEHKHWQGDTPAPMTPHPAATAQDVARFEKHYFGEPPAHHLAEPAEPDLESFIEEADPLEETLEVEDTGDADVDADEEEDTNPFRQETQSHHRREHALGDLAQHQQKGTAAEQVINQVNGDMIEHFAQDATHHMKQTAEDKITANPAEFINDVADKLLHRLLVSDPTKGDKREVRLLFNEASLPGVEVQMERVHGALEVRMSATDPEQQQALEEKRESLQQHLSDALGDDVVVILTEAEETTDPVY